MGAFIATVPRRALEHARYLQKSYYHQFGTTLSGLMQVHKLDPHAFLDYVHDIDLSPLCRGAGAGGRVGGAARSPAHLHQRLAPACRARRREARRAAPVRGHLRHRRLRVCGQAFTPTPSTAWSTATASRRREAAMFEDMPHNLEAPHALGMTTVLVHSNYVDHPAQLQMRKWTKLPEHIHHATDDLTAFLRLAGRRRQRTERPSVSGLRDAETAPGRRSHSPAGPRRRA